MEEWYVPGPLGLEQGFTMDEGWGCAGELELDVAVRGARVQPGRREGEMLLVSEASGARFSYGELAAWDADGKVLAARMEAREGGVRIMVDAAGAVFPVVVDPLVWTEEAKLTASDPTRYAELGISVALSGDTALVGASNSVGGAGSAHVFVRRGGTWTEQAKLTPSDAPTSDLFGFSVALSGESGTVWAEQAKLIAGDAVGYDAFGISVALLGERALVGAAVDDGADTGSAYVFVRSGAAWSQQAKLNASDAAAGDGFGYSVALSDETALMGAPGEDGLAGSAYVFTLEKANGDRCAGAAECASGFCTDGVCCNSTCGGGIASDCQACSVAAGAVADGTCSGTTGGACDDGNVCTQTDVCQAGTCVGTTPLECDDQNECTDESCDPAGGCVHDVAADGTPCTGGERGGGACETSGQGGMAGESGSGGAGAGGSGAHAAGNGGSGGGAPGAGGGAAGDSDDGGCSCRLAGPPTEGGALRELAWIALAALVAARLDRRRAA